MKLSSFCKEGAKFARELFLTQFTTPALIFAPIKESAFDTNDETDAFRTIVPEYTRPGDPETPEVGVNLSSRRETTRLDLSAMPDLSNEHEALIFLAKSTRNPFGAMITVGRASNNDIVLPFPVISKLHAYFTHLFPAREADGWVITDRVSRNGTYADGEKLSAGCPYMLVNGSRLIFAREIEAAFVTPAGLWEMVERLAKKS